MYVIMRAAWLDGGALPQDTGQGTTRFLASTLCIESSHGERALLATRHTEPPASGLFELYQPAEDRAEDDSPMYLAYSAYDASPSAPRKLLPAALVVSFPHYLVTSTVTPNLNVYELFSFHERGLVFITDDEDFQPLTRIVHIAEMLPDAVDSDDAVPYVFKLMSLLMPSSGVQQSRVTTCVVQCPGGIKSTDCRHIEVDDGLGIIFIAVQQEQEMVLHCLMLV
jgi:hypothetical protein